MGSRVTARSACRFGLHRLSRASTSENLTQLRISFNATSSSNDDNSVKPHPALGSTHPYCTHLHSKLHAAGASNTIQNESHDAAQQYHRCQAASHPPATRRASSQPVLLTTATRPPSPRALNNNTLPTSPLFQSLFTLFLHTHTAFSSLFSAFLAPRS